MKFSLATTTLLSLIPATFSACFDISPAFPVPSWPDGNSNLNPALSRIQSRLGDLVRDARYSNCSFSLELTSTTSTLFTAYHTALDHDATRPGDTDVDADSQYRIASISKVFTTLGILYQHQAGNLSLDDPITNYIPELTNDDAGEVPWKDITLRILASQLSGIPREFAQSDLLNYLPNPTDYGLPPADKEGLPRCDEYDDYKPCNRSQFLEVLKQSTPVFAPNFKSTYSNLNFELLGLALENVTGLSYAEYMQQAIFNPLNMPSTSLSKPDSDSHAVLPPGDNYWDVDEGIQAPTGGIYSSAADMSKFVRYILTHYNALATGVNWFNPASYAAGLQNFYGMPFEIFRSNEALATKANGGKGRPVTFTTKGGAVPGYYSQIVMLEEYGLGFTFLVAGVETGSELLTKLRDLVTVEIVREAEKAIWSSISESHAGAYAAEKETGLNSSISFTASPSTGLVVERFISNGTDVINGPLPAMVAPALATEGAGSRLQMMPTLLFKDEREKKGEIWRMMVLLNRQEKGGEGGLGEDEGDGVFGEMCLTDVDYALYAGHPINEVVFWHGEGEGEQTVVELPAWGVKMARVGSDKSGERDGWRVDL